MPRGEHYSLYTCECGLQINVGGRNAKDVNEKAQRILADHAASGHQGSVGESAQPTSLQNADKAAKTPRSPRRPVTLEVVYDVAMRVASRTGFLKHIPTPNEAEIISANLRTMDLQEE